MAHSFSGMEALGRDDPDLAAVFRRLRSEITVKTRSYHLKKFKQCFLGRDLVSWILNNGDVTGAHTRNEALLVGRVWQDEHQLFHHVCFDHQLQDEKLFYTFRPLRLTSRKGSLSDGLTTLANRVEVVEDVTIAVSDVEAFLKCVEVSHIAKVLLRPSSGVEVKDRTYHLKKYPHCFVGREAVSWMESALFIDRAQAVVVGQHLMDEGFIRHSANDRPFEDAYFFYTSKECQAIPPARSLCMDVCLSQLTDELPHDLKLRRCTPFREGLVPNLLMACARKIMRSAEDGVTGLFRTPVPEDFMERLFTLLDCSSDGGLYVISHLSGKHVGHVCCAVVKQFLYQMPIPLMTYELFENWTALGEALKASEPSVVAIESAATTTSPGRATKPSKEPRRSPGSGPREGGASIPTAHAKVMARSSSISLRRLSEGFSDDGSSSSSSEMVLLSDEDRVVRSTVDSILQRMPSSFQSTLFALLQAAHAVSANPECRMSAKELSYTLTPVFLWSLSSDDASVRRSVEARHALEYMIINYPDLDVS